MTPKYLLQDNLGNSGTYIQMTQGESRTIKVFPLNADGTPMVFTATLSTIVAAIYTTVNLASIKKSLALSNLTKLISTDPAGCLGFEFTLTGADTASIVENSSGIPMLITITDSAGNVTELNFLEAFLIDVPVVLT